MCQTKGVVGIYPNELVTDTTLLSIKLKAKLRRTRIIRDVDNTDVDMRSVKISQKSSKEIPPAQRLKLFMAPHPPHAQT